MLMFIAGVFIVTAFFVFAFLSIILLAPGFLLYNAGIRNLFNAQSSFNNKGVKIIDVTPGYTDSFADKSKSLIKSWIKKLRDFLNKYAD